MRPVHTRALVLRRTDWSETSQIVTVDTRDHGIVDLLAKGSRRMARPSSSFAEPLDLAGWYDVVYRPRRGDLGMGAAIGAYNLLALLVLLTALEHVPGTVFFPLLGCTVVALDNLCAHFVWRERLSRRSVFGVCLAVGAVLLAL